MSAPRTVNLEMARLVDPQLLTASEGHVPMRVGSTRREPLVPFGIFRNRTVTGANVTAVFVATLAILFNISGTERILGSQVVVTHSVELARRGARVGFRAPRGAPHPRKGFSASPAAPGGCARAGRRRRPGRSSRIGS